MKKRVRVIFLVCLLMNAVITVMGQSDSRKIKEKFRTDYPEHKIVTWKLEDGLFRLESTDKSMHLNVTWYDSLGNLKRRESEMRASEVPSAISGYLDQKYPGDKNYMVWVVEDESGNRTYRSDRNDTVIYFTKDGEIIPRATPVSR